jgi:molybdate transport system regulatory protein
MAEHQFHIRSALSVELGSTTLASRRWIDLLAAIDSTHSITAAAKAVGLSYKAAWDAVDAMNNLADQPLVERSVGGKGGGGTELTVRGRQLIATFRAVEAENARFIAAVNTRVGNSDQDLHIIGRLSMLTSARNQFSGKVVRINQGAVNDEVELALPGGERLVSIVTHESVENLGLKVGRDAIALVKASWIIVAVDDGRPMKLSARNRLSGTIKRLTPGAVNTEVVIELKGGNTVAAIITNIAAKDLKLTEGMGASAIFKASSVILGVVA